MRDTTKAGTVLWLATLALSIGPGCKKATTAPAGDAGEAGPTAPVAEVEAAAPPLASNEADVTRYPDEKATPGSTLTTESPAELRTEVGSGGKLVVVVKKGTEVDKVAEHASHYLVVTEDPKDATRKLMGWSSEGAFGGSGGFHGATAPVHGDAGAADGGKAAATDAGGGGASASGWSCVKQTAGKCAAPYVVNGAVCRLACKTAAECKGPEPKCNAGLCSASNGCQ